MRRSRLLTALLAVLAVASMAVTPPEDADCRLIRGADTPDDPSDDVEVCEVETFFHRATTPVGNLAATDADTLPSWDVEAPTTPAPAVYAQVGGSLAGTGQARNWATFEGEFTGNLDSMKVTAFLTSELYQNLLATYPLIFELHIDGVRVMSYNPAAGDEKDVPMQRVSDGLSRMDFGLVNIHKAMEVFELDTSPDATHTVRLSMSALYFGDGNSVYYYDSPDHASGIEFNVDMSKSFITTYDVAQGF